jgi:hypothetical protein
VSESDDTLGSLFVCPRLARTGLVGTLSRTDYPFVQALISSKLQGAVVSSRRHHHQSGGGRTRASKKGRFALGSSVGSTVGT